MTLLKAIQEFIDNITVTDTQEESIKASLSNLNEHLIDKDNSLSVDSTFTNGSYERDTNIRPLTDIDTFAVLNTEKWKDKNGVLPTPQSVLTKIKEYLNSLADYKGKVSQDRPCVTIELSNKDFDILPSFEQSLGGYLIPNYDLASWTFSYPEQLTKDLNSINGKRKFKVKPTIKIIKSWNRDISKLIPSYHIEETAISIFQLNDFTNYEEAIRLWFNNAEYYLSSSKFKNNDQYNDAIKRIKKIKDLLNDAKKKYDEGAENDAQQIWKDIFGKEFPSVGADQARNFSNALAGGNLKVSSAGIISTTAGMSVPALKGFFGDNKNEN